jgi:hypothetical protein
VNLLGQRRFNRRRVASYRFEKQFYLAVREPPQHSFQISAVEFAECPE